MDRDDTIHALSVSGLDEKTYDWVFEGHEADEDVKKKSKSKILAMLETMKKQKGVIKK